MYVKNKMITDVATVFPEASISLAFQIMHEKNVSQLPVVKDGKFVGMITEETLKDFTPSKATTLSMYELNYVLNKTKVEEIMLKSVETTSPDALVEQVAKIMIEKDVNMVPVVEKDNSLTGVIARTDIINSFLELLGAKDSGSRISVQVNDEVGALASIVDAIKDLSMNIIHVTNFTNVVDGKSEVIIRVDATDVKELVKKIEASGFQVNRIDQN